MDLTDGAVLAGAARVPIELDRAELPPEADVTVETVPIGRERRIVHVRVPAKDDPGRAWEAILAGGRPEPIFAGVTGYAGGDPGERRGKAVRIVPGADSSFVLIGDIREDLTLCGHDENDATLLDPQALYPASLELHPATVQRLEADQRDGAERVVAVDKGPQADPALAKLLVARGSSVPGSRGVELTDGDPATIWSERRPGIGQGEFAVMSAPSLVPITRMEIVVSPPRRDETAKNVAAPRTFYLVTSSRTFEVTLPGDGSMKPGEAYEIALPQPVQSSCVALVLSDAYGRGLPHPDVSVAELTAYSEFDAPGATLEDVAKKLSGERAAVATQVLERAGPRALAAVESVWDGLDARGRALAIDVAASHESCEEAAPLLVRGLCDAAGEAPRKAREKLERCKGAAGVLAAKLRSDRSAGACVAPVLATIAGADALEPIADALAASSAAEVAKRNALRSAFAQALQSAPAGRLAQLLGDGRRSAEARLEMMRAAGSRLVEAPAESGRTVDELLAGSRGRGPATTTEPPPMRLRYLVLGPEGVLARAGDAASASRLAEAIARDPDWPVRARAAEMGAGVAEAQPALLQAAHDAEPRVREATLQAMASSPSRAAVDVARKALGQGGDGWPFVRAQAVAVLAAAPASADVDAALGDGLRDGSARVRGAAVVALGRRRAVSMREPVRERMRDAGEDASVRAAAARALGGMCDAGSVDDLTDLARKLGAPGAGEDDQEVALGALVGLAAMHPPDLAKRLAPLLSARVPPQVRTAAQQALAARGVCR